MDFFGFMVYITNSMNKPV